MTPSYYTNAGNFVSALQGGVDPRTGLFNISLPLARINTNNFIGPALSLTLLYSPLSTFNNGFGKGFRLNLSRYDKNSKQLLLSNGEEYRIGYNDEVKQQKMKSFIFKKVNEIKYQIIYKSGLIEYLTLSTNDVYVPSEVLSTDGRKLEFSWDSHFPSRLTKVMDDSGTILCALTYPDANSAKTIFSILPEISDLNYSLTFQFINDLLNCVSNDAVNPQMCWTFDYEDIGSKGSYRPITCVNSPTGMIEKVTYFTQDEDGMAFPEVANLAPLPCVNKHILIPGGKQPPNVTMWSYTQKNYLGKDAGFNLWHPDSDQMLNFLLSDYEYGSTEKRLNTDGNVLCSITRRYNTYHLLVSEETIRDGKVHSNKTEFYAIPGASFKDQPPQYALPKTHSECWMDPHKNEVLLSRTIMTRYLFDEMGNPIKQEKPDGTIINYTYYPAAGEGTSCPADPHGFSRYLKLQTLRPPQKIGDEPITTIEHTWQKLMTLTGDGYYVVEKTSKKTTGNKCLLTDFTYFSEINHPELYGRIHLQSITAIPSRHTEGGFTNSERFTYQISSSIGQLSITREYIGYDGLTARQQTTRNLWTGNLLSQTSLLGDETSYTYDKLGRVSSRTLCQGSKYKNTTKWQYVIEADSPCSIETDALGNKYKIYFDGFGRAVRHCRFDIESNKWYETFSCTHNSIGDLKTGTVKDWLRENSTNIPLTSDIIYDSWGGQKTIIYSDGQKLQQDIDPIALTRTIYREGNSENGTISSKIVKTTLEKISQLPVLKEIKYATGEKYSESHFTWDGLGQLRIEQDENGAITKRTYDEYGRVLTQMLSDGTVVSRTYAPHLTGNQIASISVSEKNSNGENTYLLLGTQTFDGLGRVTKRVSGGRTTTYRYQGPSSQPSIINLPSGKSVEYVYIPELANAISKITAEGITKIYNYDNITGKILSAEEDSAKIEHVWSPSNQLKQQTFFQCGHRRSAHYKYSLKGMPLHNTDVTGKQTQYIMNEHGRVISIIDETLTVSLIYDSLGRLSKQTICDEESSSFLTTELSYDSFGRESTRTVTSSKGVTLTLSLTWTKNNLVSSRTTKKNQTTLLIETYEYDTRNRLINYAALGNNLPVDMYGHKMTSQTYKYDVIDNLTQVDTYLSDNSTNSTSFYYQNKNDPTQLTLLTNTHKNYPQNISLSYDSEGRLIRDSDGQVLTYDVTGRITSISDEKTACSSKYVYDAFNRIITQSTKDNEVCNLYYRDNDLVNEVTALNETRFIKTGQTCVGVSDVGGLTMTAVDKNNSLLWSDHTNSVEGQLYTWAPYGSGTPNKKLPGFNGERVDPMSGSYHLGNGYRAYNPSLMRFNCPDSSSPFGVGGINAYAYCSGDPINHTDPSGHLSWQAISGIVLGAIGIGLAVITAGASVAAAGSVMAALSSASSSSLIIGGLSLASDVTAIASGALEEADPKSSSVLGWVSLATGLTGMATGIGMGLRSAVRQGFKKADGTIRPHGNELPRPRYNVDLPETRPRSEAPANMWHEVVADDGHIVYGSDRTIVGSNINEPLTRIGNRNSFRDVTILSGTHGNRYGINWERTPNRISRFRRPDVRRSENLIDHGFYIDDVRDFVPRARTMNRNIHVIDMEDMIDDMFAQIITDERNHVILGYCYGINDEALRYYLNLPPRISYV